MDVHWARKEMPFLHHDKRITLTGVQPKLTQCFPITCHQLQAMCADNAVQYMVQLCLLDGEASISPPPACVEAVIAQFAHLFEEPKGLPPSRPFDHSIPLIPVAQPINLWPCRYSPQQKDEIKA